MLNSYNFAIRHLEISLQLIYEAKFLHRLILSLSPIFKISFYERVRLRQTEKQKEALVRTIRVESQSMMLDCLLPKDKKLTNKHLRQERLKHIELFNINAYSTQWSEVENMVLNDWCYILQKDQ